MSKRIYEDNPWKDDPPGTLRDMEDFLPSPAELAASLKTTKITLSLSEESIRFFKSKAEKHAVPYQVMIRTLLDNYVQHSKNHEE